MGTAPKKSRAAQLARRAADANVPASTEFVIFEDNSGSYHWRLCAADGAILAQAGGFVSYAEAKQAARVVRSGAASAQFEPRGVEAAPIDLIARRERPNGDSQAERWLDEGDIYGGEAVSRPGATARSVALPAPGVRRTGEVG
jgi:uncharacterized protein YegP (UPF0339 family)